MPLKGDAAIRYDAGAGDVTLPLDWPLFRVAPSRFTPSRRKWGLTGRKSESVVFGTGLREVKGKVRFAADPEAVLDMLEAGGNSVELRYLPSLAAGTEIPCLLVEPVGQRAELAIELQRLGYGEYAIDIRLRRVDGGDWSGLPGANL